MLIVHDSIDELLMCMLSSVDFKIDRHGRVVRHTKAEFSVNVRSRAPQFGRFVEHPVVDPPAPIQRSSLCAIRPPGVGAIAFTRLMTHRIVPPAPQQVGEPSAFMGKKSTRLLIALPVVNIPFGGGDVEVSRHADWLRFLAPWFGPHGELFQHPVFDGLSSL